MADLNNTPISEKIFCERFCNQTNTFCLPRCYSLSSCSPVCLPIPPPPPPPPRKSTKSQILSPLLIVVLAALAATLIIVFGYVFYIKYYSSRRRLPEPEGNETHDVFLDDDQAPVIDHPIWYIRTVGLQPSVISTIAVCKYKIGDGLVEGTECSVCLNEFQEDETLRLLPKCNHAFHIPCIDTWLKSHTNCPMCRAPIIRNTDPNIQDSGEEETQMGILENHGESIEEIGENNLELMIGTEEEEAKEEMNGMQPMRRSVSLDSVSASKISLVLANIFPENFEGNLDSQIVEVNVGIGLRRVGGNQSSRRFGASCSRGRGMQNGSTSMKRSFSSSLLSRYSRARSQSSALPL